MSTRSRGRWSGAKLLTAGLVVLVLGTAPFLTVEILSSMGVGDPDPNVIEFFLLAVVCFCVAIGIAVVGVVRLVGDRVHDRGEA